MYAGSTRVTFKDLPRRTDRAGIDMEDLGTPKSRPDSPRLLNPFGRFFIDFGYTGFGRRRRLPDIEFET
jgi:hypothetical protein